MLIRTTCTFLTYKFSYPSNGMDEMRKELPIKEPGRLFLAVHKPSLQLITLQQLLPMWLALWSVHN